MNSQVPTSIRDTDSIMSIESTDLVYRKLDFEDDLFTARVYKRNFRNIKIRQLFREQAKAKSKLAIVTTPTDDPYDFTIGDNPNIEEFSPSEQRQHLLLDSINDELEIKMSLKTELEALASKPAKQTKKQRDKVGLELVESMRKLLELNAELEDEFERGMRPTTRSEDLNSAIVQGSSPKTTFSDEEVEDIEVETKKREAGISAGRDASSSDAETSSSKSPGPAVPTEMHGADALRQTLESLTDIAPSESRHKQMEEYGEAVIACEQEGQLKEAGLEGAESKTGEDGGKGTRLLVPGRSSGGLREGGGSHLFTNIKNNTTKAADGLGKAGKGFFGKIARSGSSNAKEEEPEHYVICVINLPLIEQTRRTRIAQRLEDSKDKTEFWIPALPWRCIDYLNFQGCEQDGLYRVPGSDKEIRHWQKRFDQEGDINLFDEPDLYDINIIGSLFKSWLRGLPSEILPKDAQDRISTACQGKREVPQLLKDELSSLPPWNYYLLFAITCHLSLLTAYSDKNKITYSNLCICFQPALRIDAVCFSFLVQDWRNCWQGCWTEKEALDDEYQMLEK